MAVRHTLLPALTLSLITHSAFAVGPSMHLRGGATLLPDADNTGSNGLDIRSSYDTGYHIGGGLGYTLDTGIRLELEMLYHNNNVDSLAVRNDGGVGTALGVGSLSGLNLKADGDVSVFAGMVNAFFDINTGTAWTPYIGGGIGIASVSADISSSGVKLVDDSDTVFAWQAAVGLSYPLSPKTSIGAGYRYFGTGDPDLRTTNGARFESEYDAHLIEAGLRYRF